MFKLIIAGSRSVTDYSLIKQELDDIVSKAPENDADIKALCIISGGARGVDKLGERYAKENNIALEIFPANWESYGKAAGFLRNKEMGDYADGLIAFWDGRSRGTQHMINYMKGLDKPVVIIYT